MVRVIVKYKKSYESIYEHTPPKIIAEFFGQVRINKEGEVEILTNDKKITSKTFQEEIKVETFN